MKIVFWYNELIDSIPDNPISTIEDADRYFIRMMYELTSYEFRIIGESIPNPNDKNFYVLSFHHGIKLYCDVYDIFNIDFIKDVKNLNWLRQYPFVNIILDQTWELGFWRVKEYQIMFNNIQRLYDRYHINNLIIVSRGIIKEYYQQSYIDTIDSEYCFYIFKKIITEIFPKPIPITKDRRNNKFLMLSGKIKMERLLMLKFLYEHDMLCINDTNNDVLYTLLADVKTHHVRGLAIDYSDIISKQDLLKCCEKIPTKQYDYIDQIDAKNESDTLKFHLNVKNRSLIRPDYNIPDIFMQCYCNIVLETHFETFHTQYGVPEIENFTEKTIKPLYMGQFFVIVGLPKCVSHLRELGFDCFDDIIDHSYDNCTDKIQRLTMIQNEILRLNMMDSDEWYDLYLNNYDRLIYNRIHLLHNCNKFALEKTVNFLENY